MAAHLWAKAPPPVEYIRLILCRDVYHCTPSQLRQERLSDVLTDLTILAEETRVQEARSRRAGRR